MSREQTNNMVGLGAGLAGLAMLAWCVLKFAFIVVRGIGRYAYGVKKTGKW